MVTPTTSSTRLGTAGDIVVPFSEIASLLQSRLSTLELNNLLGQLLGSRSSLIQPGDLITADWAMDLSNRIAALERGDTGAISGPLNAQAVQTLFDTYDAYSGLVSRRAFLPDGTGSDALSAALGMTAAIQNILMIAAASTGPAETSTADGLVDIFQRVYSAQKDLAVLFSSSIPGVSNPQARLLFAQRLTSVLDNDDGGSGALSLKSAITQRKPDAAISAQDRVNGVVTSVSGDVVIGSIDVSYRGSTRGETLVLGDVQPFGFIFRVINRTNRQLAMQLKTNFATPRDSWTSSATIVGGSGQSLTLKPFDPSNPNGPGAMQDVQVNVVTPAGTAVGDTGTLQLFGFVPAPINIAGVGSTLLTVGNTATGAQQSRVRFDASAPVVTSGDPNNVSSNTAAELRFDLAFTTSTSVTTRDFHVRVDTTDPATQMQRFFAAFEDADVPVDPAASTPTRVQSKAFTLNDGVSRSITMLFGVLTAVSGDTLNLTTTIEAVDDATVSDTRSFKLKAK